MCFEKDKFATLTIPFRPKKCAPGYLQYLIPKNLLGRIGQEMEAYHKTFIDHPKKGVNHKQAVDEILDILNQEELVA